MRETKLIAAALICLMVGRAMAQSAPFAKGADVSWLPQMEESGCKFYNADGIREDCLQILKENGINTVRLRVFVHPSADKKSGHCRGIEVANMAARAKAMGFRVMIDFHYSDSWADPAKQYKPAAWAKHDFAQLLTDVYNHTYDVLSIVKARGVTPEWVQVGNEIPSGILWPEGSTSHWGQLTQLLNQGYDAVKAVDSSSKVVIHLDQGNDNGRFRWFFDNLQKNGGKWDVIGMSFYPSWLHKDYSALINDLGSNLKDMAARYDKEAMVVEVGGESAKPQNTCDMLLAVQKMVRAVPNGKGLGVIYWEPEGERSWSGYPLSCWGADGRPTMALTAFKDDPFSQ
jgi:arabinogalactan endo-1,4-beta-galactosidase